MEIKKVFVTGANKSIGFETAKELLKNGYYVFLGYRTKDKGQEAINKLIEEGLDNVELSIVDVTDAASIVKAYQIIAEKTDVLDVLINNAGILGGMPQTAITAPLDMVRSVFNTNFFGVINVTQQFIPLLKQSVSPVIVNVTSGLASLSLHSDPNWAYYNFKGAAYVPSKAALNAFTQALAYELPDFKVNAVDPGYTATDFNHHNGPLKVEDSGKFIARYAMLDADGPSGKFFSHELKDKENKEFPW